MNGPLAMLWRDRCTARGQIGAEDPVTHITVGKTVTLFENMPCKLSFERLAPAGQGQTAALTQRVKLFLPLSAELPAGAVVTVTRPDGREYAYRRAGEAGVFSRHREVLLEPWKERA